MKEKRSDGSFSKSFFMKSTVMLFRSFCLIFALLLVFSGFAQAQRSITGVVSEKDTGEPIPGAAVVVKGTTNGTSTDLDGKFSLQVSDGDVLQVSFVGFTLQEIPVNGQTTISVLLEEEVALFDEVVVVGYGVQKKKLVTGATVQVDGEDLQKRNTTNALQALQGQTSGVQISSTSGQPGEGLKVVVRGQGTIGNSGPLYIVDGVQTGDISYLNNADIESIDVLKDAASAAIYGSQAANGVILITTKTGKKGTAKISFDAYYGLQNVARKVDMLNSKEYAVIMNEAAINSGKAPYFTPSELEAMGEGTDWVDAMLYDNAVTQNYTLGMTGGSDNSVYSMSLSYTGQEGIVGGPEVSNYDRYNLRVNSEHKLYDGFLKVGQHLTMGYIEKNGIGVGNQYNNSLRGALNTSPFLPMYDVNGDFLNNKAGVEYYDENGDLQVWDPWAEGENNPYGSMILNNQSKNNNQKIFGDVYFELNPMKNLRFRTTAGFDYYVSEGRSYRPIYELSIYAFRLNDGASQSMSKGLALTWDNVLTYDFDLNEHAFTVMAGNSIYQNKGSWVSVSNSDLVTSDLDHAYIDNTTNTDFTLLSYGGAPNDEAMLLSYFGRLSYNYKERYMLNATFRADGSSKFAKGNRWGYFPSVSAGWVLTNESFMENSASFLDFLKLRASWGQVGNQNIDAWQYLAPIQTSNTNYYFGTDDFDASGNTVGAYPSRLSNPELKWETSEQINIGFDSQLLDGHMNLTLDWYKKSTKDWLIEAPILATAGADAPYINGGNVDNTGIELSVSYHNNIGKFNYRIAGNIAKNKNEVSEVPTTDGIVHGLTNMLYDNSLEFYHRAETGYPIGYFWGWETDGIFQNEEEVQAYTNNGKVTQPNAKPGDLRYVDQNKDGVIDESDKTNIGDPNPDYVFGFSVGFDYEGFDFTVDANGVAGNQIVQSYRNHANAYANYTTEILSRWHGEGTSTTIPRVTETNVNYLFSDVFVKDGDFLRISNITLGYDFAKKLVKKDFISQLRVYASVQNAITFTKYNGMDPEIGYGVENGSSGVDLGYYPRPRTMMVGVNIKF
ncbi:TonB-linked SusC/RagA family outer membrane protein [Mangrovibacterium diazotrophicum]|uniref:TonB-linked SusC/RagA family outer membrane protein n=2 Tax=Mangrovibacterium diazotrophicum TaxID=1261403 RepID=A0A419W987_9BACT|nr:TonB-linked SusC/RagA family outer membrane protein [Mangrovibacterium diazotrophicum]